jgi:hypothetical protein
MEVRLERIQHRPMRMQKRYWRYTAVVAGLAVMCPSGAGESRREGLPEAAAPDVHVVVINSALLDAGTLSTALKEAGRILRNAGLNVVWGTSPATITQLEGCRMPLILRIAGVPAKGFGGRDLLGYSVPDEEGSVYATVFRDRLAALPLPESNSKTLLLGAVVAHELGHLLLGKSNHSRDGLMTCPWKSPQLRLAAVGLLHFSTAEAARMQAEARRRGRVTPISTLSAQAREVVPRREP